MKVLGDKLLKCPSCRTSTLEEVVPKVLKENGVGILVIFFKLLITLNHKHVERFKSLLIGFIKIIIV